MHEREVRDRQYSGILFKAIQLANGLSRPCGCCNHLIMGHHINPIFISKKKWYWLFWQFMIIKGNWRPPSLRTMICLSYTVNTIPGDGLAMQSQVIYSRGIIVVLAAYSSFNTKRVKDILRGMFLLVGEKIQWLITKLLCNYWTWIIIYIIGTQS